VQQLPCPADGKVTVTSTLAWPGLAQHSAVFNCNTVWDCVIYRSAVSCFSFKKSSPGRRYSVQHSMLQRPLRPRQIVYNAKPRAEANAIMIAEVLCMY
jgi:hypothetical protein